MIAVGSMFYCRKLFKRSEQHAACRLVAKGRFLRMISIPKIGLFLESGGLLVLF